MRLIKGNGGNGTGIGVGALVAVGTGVAIGTGVEAGSGVDAGNAGNGVAGSSSGPSTLAPQANAAMSMTHMTETV